LVFTTVLLTILLLFCGLDAGSPARSLDLVVRNCVLEVLCCESSTVINIQSHLVNFLLDSSNKFENKIDQFFLFVLLQMVFTDEETEVVTLVGWSLAENLKFVGTERQKLLKHGDEKLLKVMSLMNLNRNSDTVYTCLDQTLLVNVTGDDNRSNQKVLVVLELNFVVHLTLYFLRRHLPKIEDCFERVPD